MARSSSTDFGHRISCTARAFAFERRNSSHARLSRSSPRPLGCCFVRRFFRLLCWRSSCPPRALIFFRQKRVGMGGRIFEVVKFRTMFIDAEADGAKWATKNDPRVTKVGMFLRKTRIDEIPQLWNVLRGDMGFVGPRPERPEFVNWLTEELALLLLAHANTAGTDRMGPGPLLRTALPWRRRRRSWNTISTTSSTCLWDWIC